MTEKCYFGAILIYCAIVYILYSIKYWKLKKELEKKYKEEKIIHIFPQERLCAVWSTFLASLFFTAALCAALCAFDLKEKINIAIYIILCTFTVCITIFVFILSVKIISRILGAACVLTEKRIACVYYDEKLNREIEINDITYVENWTHSTDIYVKGEIYYESINVSLCYYEIYGCIFDRLKCANYIKKQIKQRKEENLG